MKQVSKFLSYILRHDPKKVGVTLDERGFANINQLVKAVALEFPQFTIETLDEVVRTNDKKRFEYDVTGTMIRACQGHSIEVDLGFTPVVPPTVLYHGTVPENLNSILDKGLLKGSRLHVHLSSDRTTAEKVGQRRGKPVILVIMAHEMHRAGFPFYQSANGVWLVEHVPAEFIHKES